MPCRRYTGGMILERTSPYFAADALRLRAAAATTDTLWADEARKCLAAYEADIPTDAAIGAVQAARRVIRIHACGLERSQSLKGELAAIALTDWGGFTEPPAPRAMQDRLAEMLYIVSARTDVPLIEMGDQARYIGAALFDRCVRDGLAFDISVTDDTFSAVLLRHADEAGVAALAAQFLEARDGITARILVHHNLPVWESVEAPQDRQKLYRTLVQPYRARVLSGKMRSVLTSIPTVRDAAVDGIDYADYTELYFRMCDQPWDHIRAAQYRLIEKLDATSMLRFTNADGTDLAMDITGFTFCNSVIARNIPGSEVFSAPRIDSTTGTIVAKGRFAAKDEAGAVMEDLTLRFENGYLAEARARTGQEHLTRAIETDEGARRIGEIGIGTNPYLKRHVASILLSEKIGGSFHVALGDAYTMTDYMGDPVHVDNGNRSQLHWDITTMLVGKQGRIIADGAPIMENGLFTDPALDVINRGWAALPYDERPEQWQEIYPLTTA